MQQPSGFKLLLIEDNQGDVLLLKKALETSRFTVCVEVCTNGEDAINLLEDGFRPDLVLTDLNLPRVKGTEVIRYIKTTEELASIPVLVLSSSSDQNDVTNAYREFANGYLSKPLEFTAFNEMIDSVLEFWFDIVRLPAAS